MTIQIPVQRLSPDAQIPTYATDGDAGLDLRAVESAFIGSGERLLVKTGIAVAIPAGHVGLVHPRSGLALKLGITVLNAPGTIDSGYRGEIGVILYNSGYGVFEINPGDRIAQLVIQEYVTADLVEVEELPSSDRGAGGFGSTGVSS